jgi:hypothetical protein
MAEYLLPHEDVLAEANASSVPVPQFLRQELPYLWQEAYLAMTPRETNILIFTHGTFDYVYDDYASLEATGLVEADDVTEARLVGAVGLSQPNPKKRGHDDSRLRGWLGPTSTTFGSDWDKGHFIVPLAAPSTASKQMCSASFARSTAAAIGGWRDTARPTPACCVSAGLCIAIHRPARRRWNSVF